jgi:hypothetical protein
VTAVAVAARHRARSPLGLAVVIVAVAIPLVLVGAVVLLGGSSGCPARGPTPTAQARNSIPAAALAAYQQAGRRYDVDWAFLASIGAQECDHGRCAGAREINPSGCGGPMQIAMRRRSPCSPGTGPTLWERFRQDGDGDGRADPFSFPDSVATAALVLRRAKGAPPIGGSAAAYRRAACAYYGACANAAVAYADQVMARAATYGFRGGEETSADAANSLVVDDESACTAQASSPLSADSGELRFAPGVDARITPLIRAIGERIAGIYGKPLVVTSPRRTGATTVNGNVSDHASGNALDFGMAANAGSDDGPVGDRIAAAALVVAGWSQSRATAWARKGGLVNVEVAGRRIQVIWKTDEGGDHHDHVHVGVRALRTA